MTINKQFSEGFKGSQFKKGSIPWNKGLRQTTGYIDGNGYRRVRCPPELRERFAHLLYADDWLLEHRLVWEQSRDCCLTPWGDVHHLNVHNLTPEENKLDNSPENLEGVMHSHHTIIHSTKDMSERVCLLCGSLTTYLMNGIYEHWAKYLDGFICSICSGKQYREKRKHI